MSDRHLRGDAVAHPWALSVVTFDCYGTLVDWESGILAAMQPVLARHGVELAAEDVLQAFARAEAAVEAGPFVPYREVLRRTFTGMAADLGFAPREAEINTLVHALPRWPVYADTAASLRELQRHVKVGIISNVDDDLFAATAPGLGITPDFVVTALQVGAYKPSPRPFEVAQDRCVRWLHGDRGRWLHAAQSRFHDLGVARQFGLRTAWVERPKGRAGAVLELDTADTGACVAASADLVVPDLAALVRALACATGWS